MMILWQWWEWASSLASPEDTHSGNISTTSPEQGCNFQPLPNTWEKELQKATLPCGIFTKWVWKEKCMYTFRGRHPGTWDWQSCAKQSGSRRNNSDASGVPDSFPVWQDQHNNSTLRYVRYLPRKQWAKFIYSQCCPESYSIITFK